MSADRAATILARFNSAHNDLLWRLRGCATEAAEHHVAVSQWSPAQIGWHVALCNEFFASVLTGEKPLAQPAPEGFQESFDPGGLPPKVTTSASLEPPGTIGIDAAIERLRTSGHHLAKAIAGLSAERGSKYCVSMSFGTVSLYELADFTAGHTTRHAAQVQRATGRA
jgi:hypothetical protein